MSFVAIDSTRPASTNPTISPIAGVSGRGSAPLGGTIASTIHGRVTRTYTRTRIGLVQGDRPTKAGSCLAWARLTSAVPAMHVTSIERPGQATSAYAAQQTANTQGSPQ